MCTKGILVWEVSQTTGCVVGKPLAFFCLKKVVRESLNLSCRVHIRTLCLLFCEAFHWVTACCLWLDPAGILTRFAAVFDLRLPFGPHVAVNSCCLWLQLFCFGYLIWLHLSASINLCSCHPVLSFLCLFCICLCLLSCKFEGWEFCSSHYVIADPLNLLLFLPVSFLAHVVFGCYGRIQSG